MSLTSTSKLPVSTSVKHLEEIVELLGYTAVGAGSYVWEHPERYKSWTGVELQICADTDAVELSTRSRMISSYWDIAQQNRTIKLVRQLFGGTFETSAGRSRYLTQEGAPPSLISSGCFLARWNFQYSLMRARMYLSCRELKGAGTGNASSGHYFLDHINPRLLSNNLLITFIIAVWEEYFRATFTAALCFADQRETVLKRARLSHAQLEQIASEMEIERAIAECFSFQRPSIIGDNFKMLNPRLDLAAVMRKPYRGRKISLYESIEALVVKRNSFVHTGDMDMSLFDKEIEAVLNDVVVAVDRVYDAIAMHFNFIPIRSPGATGQRHRSALVRSRKLESKS